MLMHVDSGVLEGRQRLHPTGQDPNAPNFFGTPKNSHTIPYHTI